MDHNLLYPPGNLSNYCILDFWHYDFKGVLGVKTKIKSLFSDLSISKTSNLECIIMLFTVSSHLAEIKIFRVRRNPVWLISMNMAAKSTKLCIAKNDTNFVKFLHCNFWRNESDDLADNLPPNLLRFKFCNGFGWGSFRRSRRFLRFGH